MHSQLTPLPPIDFSSLAAAPFLGARLTSDSRSIQAGDVFVAFQGGFTDGRQYIESAIAHGASGVIWENDGNFVWQEHWKVPNVGIANLREQAGIVAAQLLNHPSQNLLSIGITGTNGKTSISQWLAQALDLLDTPCAVMGTVGNGFLDNLIESPQTTLDAITIAHFCADFLKAGAKAVAMEVSSHGLDQARVNGMSFSSAVFTNLTRDHLDYHGDMASYGQIKSRLFYWQGLKHAVINIDDAFGAQLIGDLRQNQPNLNVLSYGFGDGADVCIRHFQANLTETNIEFQTPWGVANVTTALLGRFNAQNMAATLAVLCAEGYALADVARVLAQIKPATGRMDCIRTQGKPLVVVDYAHTSDALEKALSTLQEVKEADSQLWCVFGCGGNRDRGKRPLMGASATEFADKVVLTSDNPRLEVPSDIMADILPALENPEHVEVDRKKAIEYAIAHAKSNDIILIAGKGHETYQDVMGVKHHFSDFEIAADALNARKA